MPKSMHPLRALRAATPHGTQAAFAAFLGVPVAAVQAVESGKARMTPRMAARIREMTGAADVELLRGAEGAALTLAGKRYTLPAFASWQGSAAQQTDRARRVAQEQLHADAWARHTAAARSCQSPDDYLIPWQTCEFASAAAKDWKRLPETAQRLAGWSPELPVPSQTRLTLAVQAAPVWNPAAAPPGMAAENAELFPPCYFTVAAGSGGCRMAAAFWRALCREHGIRAENGQKLHAAPTGSWRGFFRDRSDSCEPHAVFAGLDAHEAGEMDGGLFPPGGILSGGAGDALAEQALRFMEEHSEDAGSPAGILLFASLEGGTASALGSELLARLRAQFPAMPILVIGVLPLTGISPVIAAPWHIALAMQAIRRHASAALLFSNDHLLSQAARDWSMKSPGYAEANLLIAEGLSAFTAPLRFGGHDSQPVDLRALLECFAGDKPGDLPVISGECLPLAALTDRRLKTITLPWLMDRLLRAIPATTASSVGAFVRVRLEAGDEWAIHDEPPAVVLTSRIGPGLHESASVFAASPIIERALKRLAKQGRELLKLDNAAALSASLGTGLEEIRAAVTALRA